MNLKIKRLRESAILPTYGTEHSAGLDLYVPKGIYKSILPGETYILKSGIAMEIPEGYFGQMGPRSGIAIRKGLIVKNAPAIIDSDYRGELMIALLNVSKDPVYIEQTDRVAQIAIVPYEKVRVIDSEDLTDTIRGSRGLGSTG